MIKKWIKSFIEKFFGKFCKCEEEVLELITPIVCEKHPDGYKKTCPGCNKKSPICAIIHTPVPIK